MAEIQLSVYQISVKDLEKLIEKFPVFAAAELSEEARNQGAYENKGTGTGWYFTRNKAENGWVIYVGFCGGLIAYSPANADTGLRIGLQLEYDNKSKVVKSVKEVKKKGIVWDPKTKTKKRMKGSAPVVTFGKIDYIWLNKEECENGDAKYMELISLKLLVKASPFNKSDWNNNYDDAESLHTQSEYIALADCTGEEKKLLVPVVMSSVDNFITLKPVERNIENKTADEKITLVQALSTVSVGKGK